MIYTVTFNPAVDYVMKLAELKTGLVNCSQSEEIFFGSKGINVSIVLSQLGIKSKALGFVAGYTEKNDYCYALELGTAAGSATAFSEGLAPKNDIYRLLDILKGESK